MDKGEVVEEVVDKREVVEEVVDKGEVVEEVVDRKEVVEEGVDGGEVVEEVVDGGEVVVVVKRRLVGEVVVVVQGRGGKRAEPISLPWQPVDPGKDAIPSPLSFLCGRWVDIADATWFSAC